MKKIIATLFTAIVLLVACNSHKENIVTKYLNPTNLQVQEFTIDVNKDTNLVTKDGLKVKIDAGSIEASTPTVTIQIKEALTLEAILKAGLTTQTSKGILSSDGMFYINTKEKTTIKKPLHIAVPTAFADTAMQLYKGKEEDGKIVWEEPTAIKNTVKEIDGKALFLMNCASCHDPNLEKDMTGPNLKGMEDRPGSSTKDRALLFDFIRNSQKVIAKGRSPYYCDLYNRYNKTAMTSFDLTDKE